MYKFRKKKANVIPVDLTTKELNKHRKCPIIKGLQGLFDTANTKNRTPMGKGTANAFIFFMFNNCACTKLNRQQKGVDKMTNNTVRERLLKCREKYSTSYRQIAREAGLEKHQYLIGKFANGKNLNEETLAKIDDYLVTRGY